MKSIRFVGLDVHARQTHAAVLDQETGELHNRRLNTPPLGVIDFLESLGPNVRAVYEAGPTGLGLARAGAERKLDVRIAAPGYIPRGSSDRVKTDRRDAERIARLFAAGELRFVHVLSERQEAFRDLVRCIDDNRCDLMRARHRLSKFHLRHGLRYEGQSWSRTHLTWLGRNQFDDTMLELVRLEYLETVETTTRRREALLRSLDEVIPGSPYEETIGRLRCFRGINTLTAAGLCAEIGDFARFERPSRLSAYLGIVPSEYTSDQRRVQGPITKAGSTHARRLLVESAHHYRRRPAVSNELRRRQDGQDPRVCEIAWRAQRRLHSRHLTLAKRKRSNVATIAIARELAAFVWEAAVLA